MKSMHYIHFNLLILKAFMGDSADGYPGVKGIGEKTAIKLIQSYGSVENVLDHIESLTPGQQKKLQLIKENLILSKQLAKSIRMCLSIQLYYIKKWNIHIH